MYNLPYFKESDSAVIHVFIKEHPFAFITGCNKENKPVATQIPLFLEDRNGKLYLSGHMMKNTDHHKAFMDNDHVLAVFSSPHTYVSATWYSNPHQASTWNYISVHVKGRIHFLDDEALVGVLRKTTLHFENNNPKSTTVFDNLTDEYKRPLMKAIVAFEVEVLEIENVFKLSQNRDAESFDNIIEKLNEKDESARYIAKQMSLRRTQLYGEK